ncbi:oryzin precursor [Ampelomyces quisqualis]|uniref:Oryzin n=1 Tax=Ampelomyces quisqualis TaxID=50730 RepID=A0A6A5Q6Y5_AMPQU|nr:oryzin precursor [Ampelomyces quisqualis]
MVLHTTNNGIPGKYLVLLKPDIDLASIAAHYDKVHSIYTRNLSRSASIERRYKMSNFNGYAGSFDKATIKELEALPEVLFVEQDHMMKASAIVIQPNAPPGLAEISSRTSMPSTYVYDDSAGVGTFSYVVDSGIRTTHREFGGRAIFGFNALEGSTNNDVSGHGTHVAGILGGTTYGVAKKTTLVAVKVLDKGSTLISTMITGLLWAVNDIEENNRIDTAVINISLCGPRSAFVAAAVGMASILGVLIVAPSGNENEDAAYTVPCSSLEVICVGNVILGRRAPHSNYRRAPDSNYGPAVNIFAPGTNVVSADYRSDTGNVTLSGTSLAAPHVAGLVSYLRGREGPSTAAKVRARVYALGRKDVITDTKGSENLLVCNNITRIPA